MILFFDYETRSELDLKKVGTHRYATHPSTEVILFSYAVNDDPVQVVREVPHDVRALIENPAVLKVAHNAEFEIAISKYVLGLEVDNVCNSPFEGWHDTAYQAAYFGYPRSLENLAFVLRTKNKASTEEMLFFSKPVRIGAPGDGLLTPATPTVYNEMDDFPERRDAFLRYSILDTEVLREVYRAMPLLPAIEDFSMRLTFQMNFTGIPFDLKLATQIEERAREYAEAASEEALHKYGVRNLRSTVQVREALSLHGVELGSLNKKERQGIEHRLLELRDQTTGSSFLKIKKARERICDDGRLRGEFVGYGAHTGRWSSRGVQAQNFPRILSEVSTDLNLVRDYDHLRQHLRLCIRAPRSKKLVCADLSQIEARITAWLAGCEWRLKAFAEGEDIYARSAERMFHLKHVDKSMPQRQMGKCAELGLGFGGGSAAIERIAPDFYREIGERKVDAIVRRWRDANPEICSLWRTLERAFVSASQRGSQRATVGPVKLSFRFDGKDLLLMLPSGRGLYYRGVNVSPAGSITYKDFSRGNSGFGIPTKIWGGTLTENVVQALACDVLRDIMRRVYEKYKYEIFGSVHDEVWYFDDGDDGAVLQHLLEEMATPPDWAPGLVIKGEGFTADRYIK